MTDLEQKRVEIIGEIDVLLAADWDKESGTFDFQVLPRHAYSRLIAIALRTEPEERTA